MSEIRITPYAPQWETAHKVFATEYFHGRRRHINPDYLYWKFRGAEGQPLTSFLLATDDDKVIGQIGLVPAKVVIRNATYDVQWICEIMVHNGYRGAGIAKLLYDDALRRKITLGSDPSPAAAKSLERVGFKQILGPSKLFFPVKLSAVSDKKIKKLSPVLKFVPNPFLFLIGMRRLFKNQSVFNHKVSISEIDFNWLKSKRIEKRAYIERDGEFYAWRLNEFKDYQKDAEIYQQKEQFLLVLRETSTALTICDFYFDNIQTATSIIDQVVLEAKKRKLNEVTYYTHDEVLIKKLKSIGFIKYGRKADIIHCSQNEVFNQQIAECKSFEYTFLDSDENI